MWNALSRPLLLLSVLAALRSGWAVLKKSVSIRNYAIADVETAHHAEDIAGDGAGQDAEAELLIISTVDGYLHGIGADKAGKRNKLWSVRSGGPMMTSMKSSQDGSDYSVVPAVDGTLLVHHQSTNGLRKTSVTARMLAEKAPFMNEDGLIFSGSKKSRLIGIDAASGDMVHDSDATEEGGLLLGSPEDSGQGDDKEPPLWVGRTDYTVRAFDSKTGQEAFNMSYSEVHPVGARGGGGRSGSEADTIVSSLAGDVLLSNSALVNGEQSTVYTEISLGSVAASAFTVGKSGQEGEDEEEGDVASRSLRIQRKVYHRSGPHTTTLAASSSMVLSDIINGLPSKTKSMVVRALHNEGFFAITTFLADEADEESALEEGDDANLVTTDLSLAESGKWKKATRLSVGDPLLRLTELSSMHRLPSHQLRLKYEAKALGEGEYVLLPSSGKLTSRGGLYDPVLGEFKDSADGSEDDSEDDFEAAARPPPVTALLLVTELIRALEAILVLFALLVAVAYGGVQAVRRYNIPLPPNVEAVIETLYRRSQQALWRALGYSDKDSFNLFLRNDSAIETESNSSGDSNVSGNQVGALLISGDILGYGSHGTVVYKGSLNGRPVAIKRMLAQFNKAADREISLLIRSDGHSNVVRYFLSEQKGEFIYLALQLCHMSLKDYVVRLQRSMLKTHPQGAREKIQQVPDEARNALHEIALGINHLHSNRIVHRDIKPHNILLEKKNQGDLDLASEEQDCAVSLQDMGLYTLKISDMGLSKQLDKDGSSFASMSMAGQSGMPSQTLHSSVSHQPQVLNPVGTIGWQAPELMAARNSGMIPPASASKDDESGEVFSLDDDDEDELVTPARCSHRRTQRVDIFSLGCVFYYVLVPGEHPYGQWFEREANIMVDKLQLDLLGNVQEAVDLISRMLDHRPEGRPSSKQVCKHPFFWNAAKRLDFLVEFSDVLEHEQADSPIVIAVETNAFSIVGRSWDRRLDAALLEDMGKYRKYDTSSVRDCLRVIRNKRNHFNELSDALREAMAPIPTGFLFYFESRFPNLFMHCVKVACRFLCDEKKFVTYCSSIASMYNSGSRHQDKAKVEEATEASTVPSIDLASAASEGGLLELASECDGANRESEAPPQSYEGIIVWRGGAIAESYESNRGWLRDDEWWAGARPPVRSKGRPAHLVRSSTDFRYRSRLCTHWELNRGVTNGCPMRKKGKCDFAHGPLELRVKDTRRGRWGTARGKDGDGDEQLRFSGGEDVLGAARSIEKVRFKEGSVSDLERSAVAASLPKRSTFNQQYGFYSP